MMLEPGEKVLIVHRRLFEEDSPRYFLGTVDAYEQGLVKVTGFSFIRNPVEAEPAKKGGQRTKICSLASGTLIVYELPGTIEFASLVFESDRDGSVFLCDGRHFRMDITEKFHSKDRK